MVVIKREMLAEKSESIRSKQSTHCQASFNSDGVITLRNYNPNFNNSDEIIVLSNKETEALFTLFSRIGQKNKNYDLPF